MSDFRHLFEEPASAERAFVGRLILAPKEFHDHDLEPREFADPTCRRLYQAMVALWESGQEPDAVLLEDWTRREQGATVRLESILEIDKHAGLSAHMAGLAEMIRNFAIDREVRRIASGLAKSEHRGPDLLAKAQGAFNGVAERAPDGWVHIKDVMRDVLAEADRADKGEKGDQILTGVAALDRLELLERGGILVIAGVSSMGKTSMSQYLVRQWAEQGERIGVFSTETVRRKLGRRFLSRESGVLTQDLGPTGTRDSRTWKMMTAGASKLAQQNIWIDDHSNRAPQIVRAIRRGRQQLGLTIIVLDFIQKCIPYNDPTKEINQLLASVTAACREDPVMGLVALSQLSRAVEKRPDKRPRLSDLRDSGAIEQEADNAAFVYRRRYYEDRGYEGFRDEDPNLMEFYSGKARDGALIQLDMLWDPYRGGVVGPKSPREDEPPHPAELDFGGDR